MTEPRLPSLRRVKETYRRFYRQSRKFGPDRAEDARHRTHEELLPPEIEAVGGMRQTRWQHGIRNLIESFRHEVLLQEGDPYTRAVVSAVEQLEADPVLGVLAEVRWEEAAQETTYRVLVEFGGSRRIGPKAWSPVLKNDEKMRKALEHRLDDLDLYLLVSFDPMGALERWKIETSEHAADSGLYSLIPFQKKIWWSDVYDHIALDFYKVDWEAVERELGRGHAT